MNVFGKLKALKIFLIFVDFKMLFLALAKYLSDKNIIACELSISK